MSEYGSMDADQPPLDAWRLTGPLPWPREDDRLVAQGDPSWRNEAILMHGWGDRWSVYTEGYKAAADIVVDRIKEGAGTPGRPGLPRHVPVSAVPGTDSQEPDPQCLGLAG